MGKYDAAISLGCTCTPYYHLCRFGFFPPQTQFDLCGTEDHAGLVRYLKAGATGLYDEWHINRRQRYTRYITIEDTRYNILTPHYFEFDGDKIPNYDHIIKKFRVMELCFRFLFSMGGRVVAFRTRASAEECAELRDILNAMGNTKFDIVYTVRWQTNTVTRIYDKDGVAGYCIPERTPTELWSGCDEYWDKILGDMQ